MTGTRDGSARAVLGRDGPSLSQVPARRGLRRFSAAFLALVATAAPAEESRVSAAFSWSSLELSTLATPNGKEAYALDTILAVDPDPPGPLAGLRGRCLLSGLRDVATGHYAATGHCVLAHPDGDRLALRLSEGWQGGEALATGAGTWTGGTGRFAEASGEFAFSLVSWGLRPPGTHEGTGRVEGMLSRDGATPFHKETPPGEASPPLVLRPARP